MRVERAARVVSSRLARHVRAHRRGDADGESDRLAALFHLAAPCDALPHASTACARGRSCGRATRNDDPDIPRPRCPHDDCPLPLRDGGTRASRGARTVRGSGSVTSTKGGANMRSEPHVASYWAATAGPEPHGVQSLAGDRRAEVAVIGAGYTGLTAAYRLAGGPRLGTGVVAAHPVGWGGSGRSGGGWRGPRRQGGGRGGTMTDV